MRIDVLVNPSWGTHRCMFVAGASMALMAATKSSICRGRCLLEADGTIDLNTSLIDTNSEDATFTMPLPANVANQIFETLAPTVVPSNTTFQPTSTQAIPLAIATRLGFDQSFASDSYADNHSMAVRAAPLLSCPCNCTYISAACCLSQTRLVWEDPSEQIQLDPPPSNATVCCNRNTGKWVPKSAGCQSNSKLFSSGGNDTKTHEFQDLGNVRWEPNRLPTKLTGPKGSDP